MQAFSPLNLDQISGDLQLKSRAEENGVKNMPSDQSTIIDSVESEILDEIGRRARKAAEDYRSQLDLYEGRIASAIISTDQGTLIEAAGANALADFDAQKQDDLNSLHIKKTYVTGRARDLDRFRSNHKLERMDNDISSKMRTYRWLLLAILVVGESILNGSFFAVGSKMGLVGGILQAIVLSLLNIGTAILFGKYIFPYVRHIRSKVRTGALIGSLIYLLWVLGLNIFIGHYRDLFALQGGVVSANDLFARLINSTIVFTDVQSVILVAIGVGANIIAVIDVYGMDDPYPGYGAVSRRHAEAISTFSDETARCMADLTKRRDEAIEEMAEVIQVMKSADHELRLALNGRNRIHADYLSHLDHLAEGYERLVKIYWESNRKVRTEPVPIRFNNRPSRPSFLSASSLPELSQLQNSERVKVIERMEFFIREINIRFGEVLKEYQTVANLTDQTGGSHVPS